MWLIYISKTLQYGIDVEITSKCVRKLRVWFTICVLNSSKDAAVCLFFFFQAEDGIRDIGVTGVQTCALPIYQFRDKSVAQRELVSAGLLFYPVLQAADVLAYRAHEVPVGEDQREHLELMRDIARRFNERYGDLLVVPEHRIPPVGARVRDLQEPTRKMSTTGGTEQGTVYVLDEPDVIRRKFKRAQTDSGREVVRGPDKPGVSNLIEVLALARGGSPEDVECDFDGRGYGDLKTAVGDEVAEWLAPVRERYHELRADEGALGERLGEGGGRARALAGPGLEPEGVAVGK